MFFNIVLYIALIIFGVGMFWRLFTWFQQNVGMGEKDIPTSRRFYAAMKGVLRTMSSRKIFLLLKSFVLDVLLQTRILRDREDRILWISHIFIMFLIPHPLAVGFPLVPSPWGEG